jgi:putative methanogen marker protein 4
MGAFRSGVVNMLNISRIYEMAKEKNVKIGIGDDSNDGIVKKSCDISQNEGFAETEIYYDPEELIKALKGGKIDGAIRGTFKAKRILDILKIQFDLDKIQRIALLSIEDDKLFLLAPVGIDEGQGLLDKKEMAIGGKELLNMFNEEAKIGVLSGGRVEDFGRHPVVDESLDLGWMLTKQLKDMGISTEHYGILLEKALMYSNFVMAPDGISGNLIFRALHFFGGARALGAYVTNIPRIFIDTSRAKSNFSDSIALASALCSLYGDNLS